ncbi:MAG: response regulator [Pedosphaera sp. Tous-C6FEB]|nr:MAG: response regulator [Pedosphaera sp. Tous-C6FEB]
METKRILIIDDEPSMTRMIRINLEMTKRYQVREENQALRALATAHEFKPDLILLDVIMPGVDGGDLARRIKADATLHEVPVIFLTGTVTKKEAAEGAVTAGYPLLSKPVSLKNLVECMENAFAAKAHAAAKPGETPAPRK